MVTIIAERQLDRGHGVPCSTSCVKCKELRWSSSLSDKTVLVLLIAMPPFFLGLRCLRMGKVGSWLHIVAGRSRPMSFHTPSRFGDRSLTVPCNYGDWYKYWELTLQVYTSKIMYQSVDITDFPIGIVYSWKSDDAANLICITLDPFHGHVEPWIKTRFGGMIDHRCVLE